MELKESKKKAEKLSDKEREEFSKQMKKDAEY